MADNKRLRTEEESIFYVIVADRDGVKKYVSKTYPKEFAYTVVLKQAEKFHSVAQAESFIRQFNDLGKYVIRNPKVTAVSVQYKVTDQATMGLSIKQLEWRQAPSSYDDEETYRSLNRLYTVIQTRFYKGLWSCLWLNSTAVPEMYETADEAKAACQRHFEAFLKAQLV